MFNACKRVGKRNLSAPSKQVFPMRPHRLAIARGLANRPPNCLVGQINKIESSAASTPRLVIGTVKRKPSVFMPNVCHCGSQFGPDQAASSGISNKEPAAVDLSSDLAPRRRVALRQVFVAFGSTPRSDEKLTCVQAQDSAKFFARRAYRKATTSSRLIAVSDHN